MRARDRPAPCSDLKVRITSLPPLKPVAMSISETVESLLDQLDVAYHCNTTSTDSSWLVTTDFGSVIEIRLVCSSEVLLLRTGPIISLGTLEASERCRWLVKLMDANECRTLGSFSGSDDVFFEMALTIPEGTRQAPLARVVFDAFSMVAAVAFSGLESI